VYRQKSTHPIRAAQKRKETLIKKFGVDNCLKSKLIQNRIKQTNLEKYGVENAMQNKYVNDKAKKTLIENYGINNPAKLSSNRFIKETGQHITDWYKGLSDPKPGYSTLIHHFNNEIISINELNQYLLDFKSKKSFLEIKSEKLFNAEHFNKNPNNNLSYKPDFKLSDSIFVNVDGLYWHSDEVQKNRRYHFEMRKDFEKQNVRIFQFREDEINYKPEIVKSIVNNSIGLTPNKIFARKCEIQVVPQTLATKFLNENHLMGKTNAKHIGLYFENNLVSLISYKEKKNVCKIERFCSLINHNIIGGFNKLLTHIERNCLKPSTIEIHNWVDLRYGTGKHLETKGFKLIKDTLGWKWTDYKNTYNRLKCKANMDERKLTENQHAEELKWFRIYDAGQRLYKKDLVKNEEEL
jgi:hypothetical protein